MPTQRAPSFKDVVGQPTYDVWVDMLRVLCRTDAPIALRRWSRAFCSTPTLSPPKSTARSRGRHCGRDVARQRGPGWSLSTIVASVTSASRMT